VWKTRRSGNFLENMGSGCPEIAIYGGCFSTTLVWRKREIFALLRAASLTLPIYGGARSAKCQEWAPAMPGIPHPIPTFPQFFPFYPQIGRLYSLTLLPLDRLESRPTFIHYPSSPPPSVLCPDSFIRSPFVDGLPSQTGKPVLLSSALLDQPSARRLSPRRPCSAPIRLFVPHSLTVCPLTGRKARPTAVCRPRSPFVYSFPDSLTVCSLTGRKARPTAVCCLPSAVSIRLFVPRFVDGLPPDEPESPSYGGLLSAVRGLHSFIRSPIR
jgi:hypothetical protein